MLYFENDYCEGAHQSILKRLTESNMEKVPGYGMDPYCAQAKEKIRNACGCPDGEVFFLVGGTQTNAVVIASMLNRYEGVLCAVTGHINAHEAGAIEFTGHKVLTVPEHDGKMHADELRDFIETFYNDEAHEHMVFPGMVYISHPTEYGTLYTKVELENLSAICDAYQIPLFLDGARLGYGLAASDTDVTLPDIARCCHVFYIGGTKVGALCGEAVVFTRHNTPKHFLARIKQHGALLAKGRLLGIQFDTLFTDNLYFEIGKHAIAMAELLKKGLADKDIPLYLNSPTNQQFLLLTDEQAERLKHDVVYSFWEKPDEDHTVIRLVTDWATTEAQVLELVQVICTCLKNS